MVEADTNVMRVNTVAQRKRSFPPPPYDGPVSSIEQLEFERQEHPLAQIVMANQTSGALLATALIRVRATNGEFKVLRALCDTGAQTNLITDRAVQLLAATKVRTKESLCPVGSSAELPTRGTVQVVLAPFTDDSQLFRIQVKAFVLKKVTATLPSVPLELGTWPTSVTARLADPTAAEPGTIDMLLGAHVWSIIQRQGFFNNLENSLVAQDTQFGWLLFGGVAAPGKTIFGHIGLYQTDSPPAEELHRLWELEAVTVNHKWSEEEQRCEEIFARGFTRLPSGRYRVPIPLNEDLTQLGKSHQIAVRRFHHTEKRFARDAAYKRKYVEFMEDYMAQGHMRLLPKPMDLTQDHYFIPHHGLDKDKFRVVFDASAATSSGISCNDMQLLGPKLQSDLSDIILRFRCNKFALVADIKQMYRQMIVPEEQQQFQLILWRKTPVEKILTYALTTVTYGMKHAPHTAVRTLLQIARDNKRSYPFASYIVSRDFYIDDLITGAATVDRTIELYRQMKKMMMEAGMDLRKWATNSWNVLQELDEAESSTNQPIPMDSEGVRSVLGAYWNPVTDEIHFKFHAERSSAATTKQTVTSEVARIFDPTGLLAPLIVRGKLFIREMWMEKYDWDSELLPELAERWQGFQSTMNGLDKVRVPRWLKCETLQAVVLHGFAGASNLAYAAVIYSRVETAEGTYECRLLTSKTKVAPKKPTTLHRMGLSAAALLAQLMERVSEATEIYKRAYWTDSQAVLLWLQMDSQSLKTFAANRVAAIKQQMEGNRWNYILSVENPAVIAANGMNAEELVMEQKWWRGPNLFDGVKSDLVLGSTLLKPSQETLEAVEVERKTGCIGIIRLPYWWIAERHSDFTKMSVMVAIVRKCVGKWRQNVERKRSGTFESVLDDEDTLITRKEAKIGLPDNASSRQIVDRLANLRKQEAIRKRITDLTRKEIIDGENYWWQRVQQNTFASEYAICKEGGEQLAKSSRLARLSPFLAADGLLRVGGRLQHAHLTYDEKFPIILPAENRITKLLIERTHRRLLHGGPQVTAQELRKHYWLIGGRDQVRNTIYRCLVCKRFRGKTADQQMVPLVPERVCPNRPFKVVSIDYCGPFEVNRYSGRCNSKIKCYVVVFICMWSRAIHLEVVSDLSSEGFIDAYQRFAARRGHCIKIISDNATTFVGAKRKIDAIRKAIEDGSRSGYFRETIIEWKFIAPRAPWQGGSHEAAVKLLKHHLRRELCNRSFSITEFTSLITRIEACVNSRPLGTITESGTDEIVLTPMQLLIGSSPNQTTVDDDVTDRKTFANKWQVIQQTQQMFWKKWQLSYLNHLQMRCKQRFPHRNMLVGDIVLVKDELSAPQQWPMGKIEAVYPGKDGLVRNVTVRMRNKLFTRAIQKLILLHSAEEQE